MRDEQEQAFEMLDDLLDELVGVSQKIGPVETAKLVEDLAGAVEHWKEEWKKEGPGGNAAKMMVVYTAAAYGMGTAFEVAAEIEARRAEEEKR